MKREKGPCIAIAHCKDKYVRHQAVLWIQAYYRAHGSPFVPFAEAAANFLGSKPVMEGRGAMVKELGRSAIVARHGQDIN